MTLTPFLMFTGQAAEAMDLYVGTFPDAELLHLDRADDGTVAGARFRIADQEIRCIDSPPVHDFTFTASFSFFYDCPDAATLDAIFGRLSDEGSVLMPPDAYPFADRFAWVSDRFGVSWQLSFVAGG